MKTLLNIALSIVIVLLLLSYFASKTIAEETPSIKKKEFPWVTKEVKATHLQFYTFESKTTKTKVSYHVYIPKFYETAKEKRFPVLYWLHGTMGGERGLPFLARHFDAAIQKKKIPPMLVVFPTGPKSMWCDSKDGNVPMETMIVKELIPWIDKTFRTINSQQGRMVEGHSMGGYGAARLGFKFPELFWGNLHSSRWTIAI